MNTGFKLVMDQKPLDVIMNFNGPDMKEEIVKELVHRCVMTNYNNKVYRVDNVDFDVCPKDTFMIEEEGQAREISY